MSRSDLRLLPGATCVWALAVLGITAGTAAAVAAGALLIALALTAITLLGRTGAGRTLFSHVGVVLLACLLLIPALQRNQGVEDALAQAAEDGLILELTAVARQDPAPPSSGPEWARTGVQMRARTVRGPARIGTQEVLLPASVPLLVRAAGDHGASLTAVRDGDRVQLRGRVAVSGDLIVLRVSEVRPIPAAGVAGAGQEARHRLRSQARQATEALPDDESALVRGMAMGDTRGLGEEAEEMMRRAGISHLVAVSGANIALVLAAVLGPLLLMGVRRRPRLVAGGLAVIAYVWLVGDEPSVQRAATMAAPLLAARFAGVRASPVAALALTVALWSALDPVTAASIGFLLSALATAAILLAAPPLANALVELSRERLGRTAALVLAVPLVAQLACTPVLILLAPEISLWAVPVNMVVGPLIGPTTVIALLALVLGTLWPDAAELLWTVSAGGAHLVLLVARCADALPGSRLAVPDGATGVLLTLAGLIVAVVAVAGRRKPLVRWAVAAVLVAVLTPAVVRLVPLTPPARWTVVLCAVGQGDALLLRGEAASAEAGPAPGPTVLIDTGPDPAALRGCLDRLQVRSIDLLVLTHPHEDHTGGRAALTGRRLPAQQWICPLPEASAAVVPGAPVEVATTGLVWERRGLALRVLWPGSAQDALRADALETGGGEGDAANDCSIALEAVWPEGDRLVTLGDLEPAAQAELAALHPGPARLVKVAHHGSRFQHAPLYAELAPELALIPVGRENTFGHPTDQTLTLLRSLGAQVVRTDLHGTVVLEAGGSAAPRAVGPAR